MPFERLHDHLQSALDRLGYSSPLPVQEAALSAIKSGKHHFIFAPEGSGKTSTLILSVLQRLDCEAALDVPRALILVKDKAAALALEEAFKPFIRFTDLRIFSVYDQHKIRNQKDTIYEGVDILIGSVKRIHDLFLQNGLNTRELKILALDDAEFISERNQHIEVIRITESLKGCQYLVLARQKHPRFEKLEETFMHRSEIIDLS